MRDSRTTLVARFGAALTATALLATVAVPVALAVPANAVNDTIIGQRGGPAVTGNLLANDAGSNLSILQIDALPVGDGTLETNLATGDYTYTPPVAWRGHVDVHYQLTDGSVTDWGTIHVYSNAAPVAADHTVTATEDTALNVSVGNMRFGATDEDGDFLTVTGVSNATGGTVDFTPGVRATFTPTAQLCGVAAGGFDFTISDGMGGTDVGHVTVDITCVEDAPVAVDDTATMDENAPMATFDVLANDYDYDLGDTLTITDINVFWPYCGTAAIVDNKIQFTPSLIWYGDAIITYTISDGLMTDQGVLTITVVRDNVAPVVTIPSAAFGTGFAVDENVPIRVSWSSSDPWTGVLFNELQVKIGTADWAPLYSGPDTTITTTYVFKKSFQWRVRAVDREGNASDWVYSVPRTAIGYQSANKNLRYVGTWRYVQNFLASADGWHYAKVKGASVSLTFVGRSIIWTAPHTATSGWAKVYVDGKYAARVNLYSLTKELGQISYTKTWAKVGTHTIKIVGDQIGKRTNLDAFFVLR